MHRDPGHTWSSHNTMCSISACLTKVRWIFRYRSGFAMRSVRNHWKVKIPSSLVDKEESNTVVSDMITQWASPTARSERPKLLLCLCMGWKIVPPTAEGTCECLWRQEGQPKGSHPNTYPCHPSQFLDKPFLQCGSSSLPQSPAVALTPPAHTV